MDSFIDSWLNNLQMDKFRVNKKKILLPPRKRIILPTINLLSRTRNSRVETLWEKPSVFKITKVALPRKKLEKQKTSRNLFKTM